jgi:hypothetical protein
MWLANSKRQSCFYPPHSHTQEDVCRRQIRGVLWVDFYLFPRLKNIIKGARFADVAAIQERVTAVL